MITAETPSEIVLEAVVQQIEELIPGTVGSVLEVVDGRVYDLAGASVPEAFREAIDGEPIGPAAGSCGTAAFLGEPVLVSEIASDFRWVGYSQLAAACGFQACWSVPVKASKTGEVIATFAVYAFQPRVPDPTDVRLLEDIGEIVRIALETSRTEKERRELAERNEAAAVQLRQLLKAKDEFVASVAHELRTPLAAVVGFADVLSDGWDDLSDEEAYEMLGHIARESTEVAHIVDDLLVAARADVGQVRVERQPFDLGDEVSRAVESWYRGRHGHLTVVDASPTVWGDPARVRQVVRNLLNNASKYGGGDVRIEVGSSDGRAWVDVSDDGLGIPDDLVDDVFEPYVRAHDRVGTPASLGLGLSIARRLARAMDGDLTYRREDNRTVFRLELPLTD